MYGKLRQMKRVLFWVGLLLRRWERDMGCETRLCYAMLCRIDQDCLGSLVGSMGFACYFLTGHLVYGDAAGVADLGRI